MSRVHQPDRLGRHAPGRPLRQPGGDDKRLAGPGEGVAEGGDGPPVDGGGGRRVTGGGEVVDVAGVDHAVGPACRRPQPVGVLQGSPDDLGAGGGRRRGGLVRPGQSHYLVPGAEQFPYDDGADPARRTSHEYAHDQAFRDCHGCPAAGGTADGRPGRYLHDAPGRRPASKARSAPRDPNPASSQLSRYLWSVRRAVSAINRKRCGKAAVDCLKGPPVENVTWPGG